MHLAHIAEEERALTDLTQLLLQLIDLLLLYQQVLLVVAVRLQLVDLTLYLHNMLL